MYNVSLRTTGSALSWIIGVTLGLLVGLTMLIAVPRTLGHAATTEVAAASTPAASTPTTSAPANSTEAPATETPAATDNSQPAEAATEAKGDADAGKTFFAGTCAGCHGANAEGGVGPSLKEAASWTMEQFGAAVHEGKTPAKTLSAVMPHFSEAQVSPQQLADVHAFLQASSK